MTKWTSRPATLPGIGEAVFRISAARASCDYPESAAAQMAAAWLEAQAIPFRALRDGESIVIDA
jgi:hypothetical protein